MADDPKPKRDWAKIIAAILAALASIAPMFLTPDQIKQTYRLLLEANQKVDAE